jgi:hypothetical protein
MKELLDSSLAVNPIGIDSIVLALWQKTYGLNRCQISARTGIA